MTFGLEENRLRIVVIYLWHRSATTGLYHRIDAIHALVQVDVGWRDHGRHTSPCFNVERKETPRMKRVAPDAAFTPGFQQNASRTQYL